MQLEHLIAQTILQGFDAQYGRFLEVTAGAQRRFESRDWHAVQAAMKKRIHLYDHHVGLVVEQLRRIMRGKCVPLSRMPRIKKLYTELLPDYPRFEIAESFFNSVHCRLFDHRELDQTHMFLESSQPRVRFEEFPRPLARELPVGDALQQTLRGLLEGLALRKPWEDLERDAGLVAEMLAERFGESLIGARIEACNELFFRNKAAWLIAKLRLGNGETHPLLLPIHIDPESRLSVDACLTDSAQASIVFGFARAYFMVYAPLPAALVAWLREILPSKTTAELYSAIGCQKHGKTECYREYLAAVASSEEHFELAPGTAGMVMLVFVLPGYERVFKVIRDRFAPPKEVTPARVRECYRLVKEHDRVGRMADTQEYEHFVFDKRRLSPALLEELRRETPSKLEESGDQVVISHLYIERRMTPLNLYLRDANPGQALGAVEEYGLAIKQLAAANIFPGDMLTKNFGVTRHGRVVFYDYDEIRYMTEINFREIPPPRYPEDEFASEPWYSVGADDVFPEEFRHFLLTTPAFKAHFERLHGELFRADYWRGLQQRIEQGHIEDVFAYPQAQRLRHRHPPALAAQAEL
ncbi:bifunctional isocitrate dehydrogenase kinase/phosphatase [Halotalea alkalilenta]|uniref:Isocitrate dehydrogenase kinase/phosphatase n=1 Tax=Halotalea alkalilenta TaxID=376489 RepID=A0A172YJ59_9GAMM|nr:bifunctional isocitrate dehydrogenase kinase/phosphatase [Halotalea alkalilenta]ANF59216.1 bifunctional isocitrate dehydrogenase kinase/phosphatase [Halotalea alkalilenta]